MLKAPTNKQTNFLLFILCHDSPIFCCSYSVMTKIFYLLFILCYDPPIFYCSYCVMTKSFICSSYCVMTHPFSAVHTVSWPNLFLLSILCHDPSLSCCPSVKTEPTWPCRGELKCKATQVLLLPKCGWNHHTKTGNQNICTFSTFLRPAHTFIGDPFNKYENSFCVHPNIDQWEKKKKTGKLSTKSCIGAR